MSAKLIDGKKIAAEIEAELKLKVSKMDKAPRLSVVQVDTSKLSSHASESSIFKVRGLLTTRFSDSAWNNFLKDFGSMMVQFV